MLGVSHYLCVDKCVSPREHCEDYFKPKDNISLGNLQPEDLIDTRGSKIPEIQLAIRATAGTT